jgi:hypothetical protein
MQVRTSTPPSFHTISERVEIRPLRHARGYKICLIQALRLFPTFHKHAIASALPKAHADQNCTANCQP